MATEIHLERSKSYGELMGEIRMRIFAIDTATLGRVPLPSPVVEEFCYLQLRLMCETLALACLVAHGDLAAPHRGKFYKMYRADEIIKLLSDLHQDFYPVAISIENKQSYVHLEPLARQPLTKEELISLYYKCDDRLHRGRMKHILKQKNPIVVNYPEITKHAQAFLDLIMRHRISMINNDLHYICSGTIAGNTVTFNVAVAERPSPNEPQTPFYCP